MACNNDTSSVATAQPGTGVYIRWTGSLDWITGLDHWTGLLDWTTGLRYFMQKRIYDVIIDTPPSCLAKRAVLTERFGLCADGNVSD